MRGGSGLTSTLVISTIRGVQLYHARFQFQLHQSRSIPTDYGGSTSYSRKVCTFDPLLYLFMGKGESMEGGFKNSSSPPCILPG